MPNDLTILEAERKLRLEIHQQMLKVVDDEITSCYAQFILLLEKRESVKLLINELNPNNYGKID